IGSFNLRKNERPVRDEMGGDKLMRNDGDVFTNVSEEAGIYSSVIGFGLGITIGDANKDGWEDIFISNDFFERDYLYLNNQDGTFSEDLVDQMPSISGASMGADIADIDNDGHNEIFVTEMLPSDYERLKTVTTFESWDRYQYNVNNGYHHQFTRNFLHYNNQNNTYSDISRFSGVQASDWSWGALFFDMDNDGSKDLFIANGIYKDLTNQDYLQYISNDVVIKSIISGDSVNYKKLIDIIPSNPVPNHVYQNKGDLIFEDFAKSGLQTPSFSNGSAYGDLDNDGDLDLVVNNVNMPSFVYENLTDSKNQNNYLKLNLKGEGKNSLAIGAVIELNAGDQKWYYEHQPTRGFQSSMDPRPNIGLGSAETVNLKITWPSGKVTTQDNLLTNQTLDFSEAEGQATDTKKIQASGKKFKELENVTGISHTENRFIDFNRELLNYHMLSTQGPCVSFGDLDSDGKPDIITPGAKGNPTRILKATGQSFQEIPQGDLLQKLKDAEHVQCELFDADGDGDLDAYLASGGSELTKFSELLYDKVILNDGTGHFSASSQKLPNDQKISTGAVDHVDFDGDGDLDLFVGERTKVGEYGALGSGYLLENDGKGNFEDVTLKICSELDKIGMITDGKFADLDGDGDADLIVVGEFMDISIFENQDGKFARASSQNGLNGWWNIVETIDIENDGDLDLIIGNHGLNSRFKASEEHPIKMYFSDFDKNGFPEGVVTQNREDGKDYPYALRHNLTKRMPSLAKKFSDFESFKVATIQDIFSEEQLSQTTVTQATELRSIILINEGNFTFTRKALPTSVQLSPMYAIEVADINGDGFMDFFMGGNLYGVQPEMGRYDASYGHVLINDGTGSFSDMARDYGFSVKGEIRDFVIDGSMLHVFRNNDSVISFEIPAPDDM
ncbi:MAG: VCBS repeat-containing protein, partial [Saprospiraceae bacterium]|nr:VCBS repeat-containing protein [Saprospiraceae bacterium]